MDEGQEKLEELFVQALSLPRHEREAFLNAACRGAPELQRGVELLLTDNDRLSGFMAEPFLGRSEETSPAADPAHRLQANSRLGRYLILEPLGSGGMGVVYRARDEKLQRSVAIKVLASGVLSGEEARRRFRHEALALAKLNDSRIGAVYDVGEQDGADFIVMELLEGNTLRQLLSRGPIPVRKAILYSVQIAHGLAAAHDKGIVHRDLKPENLFVNKEGNIKILDFGLAKLTQRNLESRDETRTTEPGIIMGTVGYMSPEQVRGETLDHRTDIFAFGAILYELTAGKRAFQRGTYAETMTAILNEDPPSISQTAHTDLPGLHRVIHRCLQKSPEQRFQSASDMAFALEALSDAGSTHAHAPARDGRSRWLWLVTTGVAAILMAALIVWWRMAPSMPAVESATQLTDDAQPKGTMMSDASRIYFNEGPNDSQGLAQVSVAGGPTARLQTRFSNCLLSGILPDGSALLIVVGNSTEAPYSLDPFWLLPLPAGEPRPLGNLGVTTADILADGRIVFARFVLGADGKAINGRSDWFIAEKDGSNPRKLVSLPGMIGSVAAAPVGQRILLTQEQSGNRRLLEIKADGTGLREIRKLSDERNFRWTPDQRYVAYESGKLPESDVWLLPMRAGLLRRPGKPIRLTNGPLPYSLPTPSRDGKQIFALGTKQRGELVRYDMNSHQFVPFLSGISATDITFSRDGNWIAYASYPDHTLWRSRSDGTERMQLTFPPTDVAFPAISPDGTKIAFHNFKAEIFVIDTQGGTPQKVAESGVYASWSPDGNLLLYSASLPPAPVLIKDLRTGQSIPLPSSDGMSSGYWLNQNEVMVRSVNGTKFVVFNLKTRQWADLPGNIPGDIENFSPSPNGKYLYYTTGGAEPKALRYRFADHRIETITSLQDLRRAVNVGNTQMNVAPDGSPIFTRDTGYQEIYALNIRWP